MPLPNVDVAWIPPDKIAKYLLSDDHPDGRHKARFLRALGFSLGDPTRLERSLLELARSGALMQRIDSAFGVLYLVDGALRGPNGAAPVRTVWIVPIGDTRPQPVTAFPSRL